MAKPNEMFKLSVNDIEIIEKALVNKIGRRAERLRHEHDQAAMDELNAMRDLLGRLHNQKQFFRPSKGVYVSG
jgi:methyl coenzyme M reductase subunit C-like uncharacterized protein (methanogenesis marker protein 7)